MQQCLQCNSHEFKRETIHLSPEIKGECVPVEAEGDVCVRCAAPVMNGAQMNRLRRLAADAYRKAHQLLTSHNILTYRKKLGLSQAAFAAYLNVGESSIKRWETYFVQDRCQDEHMRLKCDEAYAILCALELQGKTQPSNHLSGFQKFSFERFKNVVLVLTKLVGAPLFLNKLLFYVDFLHFKNSGKSLTGSRFVPLEYGPCPDQFQTLFAYLEKMKYLKRADKHTFIPLCDPDLSTFSQEEKETLKQICTLIRKKGARYLYDLSHEEKAFQLSEFGQPISYDYAQDLLLPPQ